MGSMLKWLFGIILTLLVLIVAAAIVLPMVLDPNDYKAQIEQKASEQLGRKFTIDKNISLSVFPWLGLETGGVRIANAAGFGDAPFAEIDELDVRVKLLPLLSKHVEVDTLVLNGLRLNLQKAANGTTNWDDLAAKGESEPKQPSTPTEGGMPVSLQVQGVKIEDARISWDDRQSGQQYVVDGVHLVTGALAPGATVPVEAGMVISSDKPVMKLETKLNADVSSDAQMAVFTVSDLLLDLSAEGEGLPDGGAHLQLKTDLVADTKAGTLTVSQLAITGPAMSANAKLDVTGLNGEPSAKGHLSIAETNPKQLASMFASPIETSDPDALTKASGEFDFSYAEGALKLEPLTFKLDESSLNGHLYVLDTAKPVVRTKLGLDQIDLDRYMPPATQQPATAAQQPAAPAAAGNKAPAAGSENPFAGIRTLDFDGDFTIGKLKVSNARMSNVNTHVQIKNGMINMDPIGADLYEGKYSGKVIVDARSNTPKVATKNSLTGIQIGPLLGDVVGEDRLVGKGELTANVRLEGMDEAQIKRTLNGTTQFRFTDGAWKGVNLAEMIRSASSALGVQSNKVEVGTPGQTDFSEMGGTFAIKDGVISNNDLQAKSPLLRIEGKGQVDLPKNSVDYLVVTELVSSLAGQGGKSRDELAGVPIPVRVTGSLADPKYRPDLNAALSANAKAKLKEKAEEKVQGKLNDALKGLLK